MELKGKVRRAHLFNDAFAEAEKGGSLWGVSILWEPQIQRSNSVIINILVSVVREDLTGGERRSPLARSRRRPAHNPDPVRPSRSERNCPLSLTSRMTDSHVLTTYAGLLLRNLLNRFNGDVEKAVGAYNGGPRNPNLRYAAGVQAVAGYARNILKRVTAANERATEDTLERGVESSSQ